MNIVARLTTPLSASDCIRYVQNAYVESLNRPPSSNTLMMLCALVWIETGRGNLNNRNFGNITASATWTGDAWRPTWFEITEASSTRDKYLHEQMLANRAPSAFRAYSTFELGARNFIDVLRRNFPEVIIAADSGDADTFRRALSQKYSKDYANNVEAVNRNFTLLAEEFRPLSRRETPTPRQGGLSVSHSSSAVWVGLSTSLLRSCDDTKKLQTLRLNDQGPDVLFLRTLLGLPFSILYSVEVVQRVRDFQRANNLVPDGICGPLTWGRLRKMVGGA